MSNPVTPPPPAPGVPRPLVLLDLDDTLFTTRAKNPAAHRPAAVDRMGRPLSYQTDAQVAFWAWLQAAAGLIIPVTGRNVAALSRVQLALPQDWAICSFGGTVLHQGAPWAPWHQQIAPQAEAAAETLAMLLAAVLAHAAAAAADVRASIVRDLDVPLYLSIKHNQNDHAALAAVAAWLRPHVPEDWAIHLNANNLAAKPSFLGKSKAVAAVIATLDPAPPFILAAGDSLSDLGYMRASDFALVPRDSQILAHLPSPPAS